MQMITQGPVARAWVFERAQLYMLPPKSEVVHTRRLDGAWMVAPLDLKVLNMLLTEQSNQKSQSRITIVQLSTAQAEALDAERVRSAR